MKRSVHFVTHYDAENASARYRCGALAQGLTAAGWDTQISHLLNDLETCVEAPMVVLHGVFHLSHCIEFIHNLKAANKILVYSVDDLLFSTDWAVKEAADMEEAGASASLVTAKWDEINHYVSCVKEMMALSDCAICCTQYLADRASQMEVIPFVVRNSLPDEVFRISCKVDRGPRSGERVVLGYLAGTATHNRDLAAISTPIETVLRDCPQASFRTVGPVRMPDNLLQFGTRVSQLPAVAWRDLPKVLASLDLNLAPIDLSFAFNHGKSHLKWLEAAAVRVPTIASASDEFCASIADGQTGFIAANSDEWVQKLRLLIRSRERRLEVGNLAFEAVNNSFLAANQSESLAALFGRITEQFAKTTPGDTRVCLGEAGQPANTSGKRSGLAWLARLARSFRREGIDASDATPPRDKSAKRTESTESDR